MPLQEVVTVDGKEIVLRELTVKEIYDANVAPPADPSLIPLYLALELDYPLVLASANMPPEELVGFYPSDLDRVKEAFRRANPFLEKPMVKESREQQRQILVSSYSGLFAASLRRAMGQEPGITQ